MASLPDGAHHRSGRALRKRLEEDLMGSIVCGVDDSESAKETARVARALSAKLGHRIVFMRGVETVDRLVAAAAEEKANFIVVGSNGPYSSLGSSSAETSRRAPCPVIVVPPGADERSTNGHQQREVAAHTAWLVDDRNATGDFAGGIVRFSLGSRTNES